MEKIELNVIKVRQPIGNMYIGKIQGRVLWELAQADIRKLYNNEDYIGIQRELDLNRVKNIRKYINTSDASFPNSIILNLNSQHVIEEREEILLIEKSAKVFSIIDGQHRLAGFEKTNVDFEVIVTIFIDLDDEQQAILFKTINSEQKKVNPSFKYDLEAYSTVKTPEKMIRGLALAFNMDYNSPWYGRIKMNGKKDEISEKGVISQKAFADPIVKFIYNEEDRYELRDILKKKKEDSNIEYLENVQGLFSEDKYDENKYIFWMFYSNDKDELLYKILLNYFLAVHSLLKEDWEYNKKSILIKTTGYNALMKLFKDVYSVLYREKNFTRDRFEEIMRPIQEYSGSITAEKYGASGESASNRLYIDLRKCIL